MISYIDATRTPAALRLYLAVSRDFWLAEDLKTGTTYGRFNGEWWAA